MSCHSRIESKRDGRGHSGGEEEEMGEGEGRGTEGENGGMGKGKEERCGRVDL